MPSGATNWIKINAVPFTASLYGQKAAVLATFSDVTTQIQNSKFLNSIITHLPGVIFQLKVGAKGHMSYPFISQKICNFLDLPVLDQKISEDFIWSYISDSQGADLKNLFVNLDKKLDQIEWEGAVKTELGAIKKIKVTATARKEHDYTLWDGMISDSN